MTDAEFYKAWAGFFLLYLAFMPLVIVPGVAIGALIGVCFGIGPCKGAAMVFVCGLSAVIHMVTFLIEFDKFEAGEDVLLHDCLIVMLRTYVEAFLPLTLLSAVYAYIRKCWHRRRKGNDKAIPNDPVSAISSVSDGHAPDKGSTCRLLYLDETAMVVPKQVIDQPQSYGHERLENRMILTPTSNLRSLTPGDYSAGEASAIF